MAQASGLQAIPQGNEREWAWSKFRLCDRDSETVESTRIAAQKVQYKEQVGLLIPEAIVLSLVLLIAWGVVGLNNRAREPKNGLP